jgi:hypothetical protein
LRGRRLLGAATPTADDPGSGRVVTVIVTETLPGEAVTVTTPPRPPVWLVRRSRRTNSVNDIDKAGGGL